MKCLLCKVLVITSLPVLLPGQDPPDGKVHRLPDAVAEETVSLNPEYLVFGEDWIAEGEKLPLLILLHGGGGTGLEIKRIQGQAFPVLRSIEKAGIKTLLVLPQASKNPRDEGAQGGWIPADLDALLAHVLETLPVDSNRVYLAGNSMGGYGTYAWAGVTPGHFAAIAPMVGGLGALGPKDITDQLDSWGENLATLPMKAYYGRLDKVVPADRGEMVRKAIEKAGGKQAHIIVIDDMGHNAGQRAFGDPEFFRWMFDQRR